MPTDLDALFEQKCKALREKEKERQNNSTMLSVWVIICLVMLLLLFVDKSYSQALAQLMYLF